MRALLYLHLTRLKNGLKRWLLRPTGLILTVVIAAFLGLVFWSGAQTEPGAVLRPMGELYAIVALLLIAVYALVVYNGLGRGTSLYSMADVQLLFPSPLSPAKILGYGLLQQLGTCAMTGLFLIFQYGWVHQVYGISFTTLLVIMLFYGFALFMGQLTAMTCYRLIDGQAKRRKIATGIFFGFVGLFALGVCILLTIGMNRGLAFSAAVCEVAEGPITWLFPVGGWLAKAYQSASQGQAALALLGLALCVVLAGVMARQTAQTGSGFYEDVLASTSRTFQAVTAQKQGRPQEALPEHVKLGKTGLGGGWGASALFYKHRLETRRGKKFLLETKQLIFMIATLAFAFFFREEGLLPGFCFGVYILFLSTAMGRWVRELLYPWVYQIPAGPFVKLLWCMAESVLGLVVQSVVTMGLMGLICGATLAELLMGILAYFLMALLFMSANLMTERFFGAVRNQALVLLLYGLVMLVQLVPGIALMVVALVNGFVPVSVSFTVMGALALPSLAIIPLSLFLSRKVLDNVELMNG